MAEKKTKTVRLTHVNGVHVSVREEQAQAVRDTGLFTDTKATSKSSSNK